ncbi:MAG: ribosome-associated translation inhibitor RaiA [Planctomycetia bacterium]|nr:ribosome-associated translation inhibitor RaiA [Planctomycetia bacterium]
MGGESSPPKRRWAMPCTVATWKRVPGSGSASSRPFTSKISAKVSRLKRYFDRLTALNVTVDLENPNLPSVEIVASAEHFHEMVSREHAGQLWRSVDGAVQKLEQQLRKHKEKVRDHKHVQSGRRA